MNNNYAGGVGEEMSIVGVRVNLGFFRRKMARQEQNGGEERGGVKTPSGE